MDDKGRSITQQVEQDPRLSPSLAGELSALLGQIGLAGKAIAAEAARAGLGGSLGPTGRVNVHGEEVKKLDEYANRTLVEVLITGRLVCTLVSEEMEKPGHLAENCPQGKFTVFFDPLDGSSNIDVNGSIGTIVSIHRRLEGDRHGTEAEWLRPGSDQVAACYVLYGPSLVMVYTAGAGVHGFTMDPARGEFLLTHVDIRIPKRGRTYSVNEANYSSWSSPTRQYVDSLKRTDSGSERPYSSRYVGALVADFHRTLLNGGIFLYPADGKNPNGKLRLLYEAAPLAFIAHQAGGRASTGREDILAIRPTDPHQRVPLLIGSPEDVALAEAYSQGRRKS